MALKGKRISSVDVTGEPGAALAPPAPSDGRKRLIGQSTNAPDFAEIDISDIRPNPDQPRKTFDPEAIRSLAESIEKYGQQQPILVRRVNDYYELIAGERRLRAHRELGRPTILAAVTGSDTAPHVLSLVENVQRQDLDALELAGGLKKLVVDGGYSQRDAAAIVGMPENVVTRSLGILALPEYIQTEYLAIRDIVSRSTLIELTDVGNEDVLRSLWEKAKQGKLTRDEIRTAVRRAKLKEDGAGQVTAKANGNNLKALARTLTTIKTNILALDAHRSLITKEHREVLLDMRKRIDKLLAG
ncbi:MAG: ParB/RepB/Spo0J family partition protein [Rhodospirillaceae bacterium]